MISLKNVTNSTLILVVLYSVYLQTNYANTVEINQIL